jgi:hypothetical protein
MFIDSFGSKAPHGGAHAVSDDATRLFFIDLTYLSTPGLYERLVEPGSVPSTVAVSASERAGDNGEARHAVVQFIGATHDGSVAYFNSTDQLTDAATPGGGIYRFELAASVGHRLTQITPDAGDPSGLGANAILSDDGSHLYFTSPRALTSDAVSGALNVYVWDGSTTRFVAALPTGGGLARVSRSGQYALFMSTDSVDGAPNDGHEAIYEYDAASGHVVCVSCRPDGSSSEGDATLANGPSAPVTGGLTEPRNIADDGAVFFVSSDRLVAADQTAASDVYEYRQGVVSLLTAGSGDRASYIADNSDDGRNVFFLSASPLLSQDRDPGEFDVYDARVDGGFPEAAEDLSPACRSDDCQDPPSAPPVFQGAASASFAGAGNLAVTAQTKPVVEKPVVRKVSAAQKLSKALRACKTKSKKGRRRCESQARKRFGVRKASSKSRGSK